MRGRGYKVAAPGTLAMSSYVTIGAGTGAVRNCVTADGKNVYVVNSAVATMSQFARDVNTGALTPLSAATIATSGSPSFVSESPDAGGSKNVYVSNSGYDTVRSYTRDTSTGLLAIQATIATGATPMASVVSPDGLHFYVACKVQGGTPVVSQFSRNQTTGALTALSTASVALTGGNTAIGIAITKNPSNGLSGKYVYVGNFGTNLIHCLVRDAATGLLTLNTAQNSIATPAAGNEPAWLAISPDDKHLYVAFDGTSELGVYAINQTDGSLSYLAKYAGGNGPWAVAVTPDGLSVYTAGSDGQTVQQYTRDPATGLLTAKVPAYVRSDPLYTVNTGSAGPNYVSVSPDGKHLYANGSISPYSVPTFNIHP